MYAFTMFKGGKKMLPVFLKSHVQQHSSFLTGTNGIDYWWVDSFLFDTGVTGCKKRILKSIQQKEHRLSIFTEGELMKQADDLLFIYYYLLCIHTTHFYQGK